MLDKEASRTLEELKIGALDESEVGEALGVLERGMRDNPTHVAVFGKDPEVRRSRLRRVFGVGMDALGLHRHMLVARRPDGSIVGVCGAMPPGECRPGLGKQLRLAPHVLSLGPRTAVRAARWMGAWANQDPEERHWHLGPVAVDAHLQGIGVGSKLMRSFCAKMDAAGEDAYLETDKPENVRFYERFGFEVIGEKEVLGNSNWFMLRRPQKSC
jgi:ribosomal protein S18 acetylase RimI-like enzyme